MKKYYILVLMLFLITGCKATVNINIDKDVVTEKVDIYEDNSSNYNNYKNWNGFPIPLYYDQKLKTPIWMPNREKEQGVSYYTIDTNDINRNITATGKFSLKNHTRSYLVRNCFKLYNIINEDSKTIFSTSKGLICALKNFDIKIYTPYTVINNNANRVDTTNNIYTWNINSTNTETASIYLEIDFSKKYNESNLDNGDNNNDSNNHNNSQYSKNIIAIMIITSIIIIVIGATYLYNRKRKLSE